jgi:hypothetical protein
MPGRFQAATTRFTCADAAICGTLFAVVSWIVDERMSRHMTVQGLDKHIDASPDIAGGKPGPVDWAGKLGSDRNT